MAQLETWLRQDLKQPLKVQYLGGNLFSQDNQANLIGVEVFDEGVAATLGGTVSASVIRADGTTVTVSSGTVSGNKASVELPQAAYAVPGQVSIVLKLTQSGVVTTLAALVAIVYKSSTDTVIDPGTILPSVETLIAQINTAVASIPADYSSLWTSLAPAFSDSTAYAAGQYVTYNGHVYRFTANHAAGSFVSTDCTQVDIGGELSALKSAFDSTVGYVNLFDDLIMGSLNTTTGAIQDSYNRCTNQSIHECAEDILCTCESGYQIYVLKYNNDDTVTVLSTWTSSFLLPANTSVRFMVKKTSDAVVTVSEAKANVSGKTDAISKINENIDEIEEDITQIQNEFDATVSYVNLFDDLIMGSLNTDTGGIQTSTDRCTNQSIRECSEEVLCSCETGYQIYVLRYNSDNTVTVLSTWTSSFSLPANTRVRFMVKKDSGAITVNEAKANVSGETDAISKINVQIDEITQNITEIADRFETVNLFDNEWEAGSLYTNGNEITGNAYRTEFIPVKAKTKYTLQNEVSGASPYLVGLIYEYTASKVFIKRHSDTSVNIYSFETDAATAYIRFRTAENASATETGAKNAKYMLHEGQGYSGYLEYGQFTFNDNFVLNADGDAFEGFNLYCNYFDYAKDAKPNDGTTGSRFDANNLTAQDVYDAYDALVSVHADYVSKTDLGMDESNTYHVYQYKFMPPVSAMINSSTGTAINEPPCMFQKIIITSGTHGDGEGGDKTDSIISVYNLMKALCDNYKGNPALSFIRRNVEVIVIPCVNPWGVTNKSRYNSNDVDINRNFDAGWSSSAHSGSSAASEAETQIMQNLFDNNTDAVAHVEVHTRGGNTWAQTSTTFISETLKTSKLKYVMQTVTAYLKNKFGATGTVNIDMLDVGMIIDYSKKVGIESTLLECAFMSAQSEPALHSKETDKRNTEFVADTVIKSLQWFIFHPNLT